MVQSLRRRRGVQISHDFSAESDVMIFINDDNTTLLSQTEEIRILPICLRANKIPVHWRLGAKYVITVHWRLSFISLWQ